MKRRTVVRFVASGVCFMAAFMIGQDWIKWHYGEEVVYSRHGEYLVVVRKTPRTNDLRAFLDWPMRMLDTGTEGFYSYHVSLYGVSIFHSRTRKVLLSSIHLSDFGHRHGLRPWIKWNSPSYFTMYFHELYSTGPTYGLHCHFGEDLYDAHVNWETK